jgi:hypothetical protein
MAAIGTKRTCRALRTLVRFRSKAGRGQYTSILKSGTNNALRDLEELLSSGDFPKLRRCGSGAPAASTTRVSTARRKQKESLGAWLMDPEALLARWLARSDPGWSVANRQDRIRPDSNVDEITPEVGGVWPTAWDGTGECVCSSACQTEPEKTSVTVRPVARLVPLSSVKERLRSCEEW